MTHAEKTTAERLPRPPMAFHIAEACELLNISRSTLQKLANNATIKTVKLGGRVLVPASEIDRILAGEAQS
jgi:excisionase family DNA binding protein